MSETDAKPDLSARDYAPLRRAIAGVFEQATNVDAVLEGVLRAVCDLDKWGMGQVWMPRADFSSLECRACWTAEPRFLDFHEASRAMVCAPGVGLPGLAWSTGQAVSIRDLRNESGFLRSAAAAPLGLLSALAVPLVDETAVVVVLELLATEPRTGDEKVVECIRSFGPDLADFLQRRRERAEEEGADRIRTLFDSPMIGIVFWDTSGRILDANDAFLETVGYSRDELASGTLSWERLSPPGDRLDDWVSRQIEATSVCPPFEKECVRKDGQRVPVLIGGSPAPGGRCAVCFVIDITERRRVADALRESEARFRAFMDNSPTIAFMKDAEGRHLYHNARWTRLFGIPLEVASGRSVFDFFPAEVASVLQKHDDAIFAGGQPAEVWERVPTADGVLRDWLVLRFPFEPAPGRRLLGAMGVDMTERRRAEAALQASEERYRRLVEFSPDAIFLLVDVRVTFVNQAAVRLLGGNGPEDIVGRSAYDIAHPDFHPLVRERLRQLAEGAHFRQAAEQRFIRLDGSLVDVEVFSIPLPYGDETVQIVARDITERKRAEAERARLLALEQIARAESEALSRKLVHAQEAERRRIARELHDEIGQMLTCLSLMIRSVPAPPGPWRDRSNEVQQLITELTARVRQMSLDLRPAMLDDLGLLAALLWHFERYTSQTGIKVRFHHFGLDRRFDAELETASYRVVQEALTNVARHAGTDEVDVHVRARPDLLWLRIADRGVGFEPNTGGRGGRAGLVGMRERVSSLGGQLRIDSSAGQGTYVTAWLPLRDAAQSEMAR